MLAKNFFYFPKVVLFIFEEPDCGARRRACYVQLYNENFDIKMMEIGKAVEAGQHSQIKGVFLTPFLSNAAQPRPLYRFKTNCVPNVAG